MDMPLLLIPTALWKKLMIKTPYTEQWKENQQYQLVPADNNYWKVRILEGDFVETVFSFGSVSFDEKNLMVKFDYDVVYSPDSELKSDNPELQKVAGKILHSILVGTLDDNQP